MINATECPDEASSRYIELRALLQKGLGALLELKSSAEQICLADRIDSMGFSRTQMESLCQLLSDGAAALGKHILALETPGLPACFRSASAPREEDAASEPAKWLSVYRGCCRRLCDAMKEAIRLSDKFATIILRDLILRLEKLLWMIDTPTFCHGVYDARAVRLFMSC